MHSSVVTEGLVSFMIFGGIINLLANLAWVFVPLAVIGLIYLFTDSIIRAGSWLSAHAFLLGAMMFFVSRILAFVVAAHDVIGVPQ